MSEARSQESRPGHLSQSAAYRHYKDITSLHAPNAIAYLYPLDLDLSQETVHALHKIAYNHVCAREGLYMPIVNALQCILSQHLLYIVALNIYFVIRFMSVTTTSVRFAGDSGG